MKHKFLFLCTASLMVLLGTSDAMRGIFTPLFREGYGFSVEQLGVIVSLSYVGNLLCLLAGGVVLDAMGRRRALVVFILLLAASELLLLQGSRFSFLAVGFFLTLGLSTLLNATVNLISSEFSEKKKLAVVNSLFFIQGVGTSGSQLVFSHYASSQAAFTGLVSVLAVTLALLSLPFFLTRSFAPKVRQAVTKEGTGKTDVGGVALLTGALAFYLIAEHGVTNYLILYGSEHLKQSAATAGTALALFSAGIMVGRLLLATMVDRVGPNRIITLSLALGSGAYIAAFATNHLNILFFAGLFVAVVYPSIVAVVSGYAPPALRSRVTTGVISIASLADVLFNLGFGRIVGSLGYGVAMALLCVSLVIALLCMGILWMRTAKTRQAYHSREKSAAVGPGADGGAGKRTED